MAQTIADIRARLEQADDQTFPTLQRSLAGDTRKGVQVLLRKTEARLERERAERERLRALYAFDASWHERNGGLVLGMDEVGRGPLAGPLTVAAVVFGQEALADGAPLVEGLNDSKQIAEQSRPAIAQSVKEQALAWTIVHVEPQRIDQDGMTACLRHAFTEAISRIDAQLAQASQQGQGARQCQAAKQGRVASIVTQQGQGTPSLASAVVGSAVEPAAEDCVRTVLLDGNPMHLDPREVSVVKGDARSASIAAASVIAKVARDALMVEYDAQYPGYDFAASKGYGSARHREAIQRQGLSPIHRTSFCQGILQVQGSLF